MSNKEQTSEAAERGSRFKRMSIAAGVLIAVFLLGYVPSCRSANFAERQRAQLEHQLDLARLHSQLGMVSFEVNRNNYSKAATLSTDFFNNIKTTINSVSDAALQEQLQAVSARRDEITAHLAQADPTVKEKIAQMYADFNQLAYAP